jgi:hypothetical protein
MLSGHGDPYHAADASEEDTKQPAGTPEYSDTAEMSSG